MLRLNLQFALCYLHFEIPFAGGDKLSSCFFRQGAYNFTACEVAVLERYRTIP